MAPGKQNAQLKRSINTLICFLQVAFITWMACSWILYYCFFHKDGNKKVFGILQRFFPRDETTNAIFFNVFIPTGELRNHAISITRSQMSDIRRSSLAHSEIFCNLFGDVTADVPMCASMDNCQIMKKLQEGNEITTLSDLYNYCLEHPESTVTYIHNKGSFTNTPENTALREIHMRAQVRTNTCRQAVDAGTCNVCSARFSPLPHFHTSGNMWTAHCSYVKDLISPMDFERKMDEVIEALQLDPPLLKEMFPCTGQPLLFDCVEPPHIGLKRYCSEHWIHSHPYVVPCDVLPTKYKFVWNYNDIPNPKEKWIPDVFVGPRFPLSVFLNNYIPSTPKWFALKGRIFEWQNLYKALPPKDSWVWYYYGRYSWETAWEYVSKKEPDDKAKKKRQGELSKGSKRSQGKLSKGSKRRQGKLPKRSKK